MEIPKVKIKVHDPPNLMPGIDVRCFAKKMHTSGLNKIGYILGYFGTCNFLYDFCEILPFFSELYDTWGIIHVFICLIGVWESTYIETN